MRATVGPKARRVCLVVEAARVGSFRMTDVFFAIWLLGALAVGASVVVGLMLLLIEASFWLCLSVD